MPDDNKTITTLLPLESEKSNRTENFEEIKKSDTRIVYFEDDGYCD